MPSSLSPALAKWRQKKNVHVSNGLLPLDQVLLKAFLRQLKVRLIFAHKVMILLWLGSFTKRFHKAKIWEKMKKTREIPTLAPK